MKKLIILLSFHSFLFGFTIPKIKVGDWWTIKYKYHREPYPYRDYYFNSYHLLKFTVDKEDSSSYIINIETPDGVTKHFCIQGNDSSLTEHPRKEKYIISIDKKRYKTFDIKKIEFHEAKESKEVWYLCIWVFGVFVFGDGA